MICKRIEEISIKERMNQNGKLMNYLLKRHLKKCVSCRMTYGLIKDNFSSEIGLAASDISIADYVMKWIDPLKYQKPRGVKILKRAVVLGICLLLVMAATVNAETITKVYESLFNIQNDHPRDQFNNIAFASEVYEKYRPEIEKDLSEIQGEGHFSRSYDEKRGTFEINAVKTIDSIQITFGFKGKRQFTTYAFKGVKENSVCVRFEDLNEAVASGNTVPYPNYKPENFIGKMGCSATLVKEDIGGVPRSRVIYNIYLEKERGKDQAIFIHFDFTKDKKCFERLKKYVSMTDKLELLKKEIVQVGGKEAVYVEYKHSLNNFVTREIQMDDYPIESGYGTLTVSTDIKDLPKEELIKVLENITIMNDK